MNAVQSVQVEARGSATAFDSLAKAACDIGMSSRKIKPAEQAMLTALGDMTSPACEHVLALDGIAIVVNKGNPVPSLSRKQIAGDFQRPDDRLVAGGRPGRDASTFLPVTIAPALTTPSNPLFWRALRSRPMRNALRTPMPSPMPSPRTPMASALSACLSSAVPARCRCLIRILPRCFPLRSPSHARITSCRAACFSTPRPTRQTRLRCVSSSLRLRMPARRSSLGTVL